MLTLMWQQAICATIEGTLKYLLNKGKYDEVAMNKIVDKRLSILVSDIGMHICLQASTHGILVTTIDEHADCTITTSIKSLNELKQGGSLTQLIKQDQLDIDGDIKVAQQYATFFESISFDIASELANQIGDVPTHLLSRIAKSGLKKVKFAKKQISEDATQWLVHERKWLATSFELNSFAKDVASVSQSFDQLDARLNKLVTK